MALVIDAMVMQGIQPGPNVAKANLDPFWGLIVSMWIGNAMLVILNLPLVGVWVYFLRVLYNPLFPATVAFCAIDVWRVNNTSFNVYLLTISGPVGNLLVKLDCEPAPFVLGFILVPMLEEHLRRTTLWAVGRRSVAKMREEVFEEEGT